MILEPTVTLLARSSITDEFEQTLSFSDEVTNEPDLISEYAGRRCYQSFHRPSAATDTTEKYLMRTVGEQHHYSILAHASFTFDITGVSRSFTHELIRSRFLAFSQLSQRFVDSSDMDWVCPPLYRDDVDAQKDLEDEFARLLHHYELLVSRKEAEGVPRKQVREAARCILPNMIETRITVSGNIRAWRDFISLRWTEHADAEIREVAGMLYDILVDEAPYSMVGISWEELNS